MSDKLQYQADIVLTIVAGASAMASNLDNIEQWGRVILEYLSIVSVACLILVNWKKALQQIKDFFK